MATRRTSRLRRHLPSIAALVVVLIALTSALIGGCIRRVAAPSDVAPAESPYSAVASWLEIDLPPRPSGEALPLPPNGLRLALYDNGRVWMDSALADGREDAVIEEGLEQALQALGQRTEPVVLLGVEDPLCSALQAFEERVLVAVGESRYALDSKDKSEPLLGVPLKDFCTSYLDEKQKGAAPLDADPPSEHGGLPAPSESSDLTSR